MSPTTPFLPLPDNSQYPNQMDYFNDYASLYPTSSAREEPNTYQPPDQTSANGGAGDRPFNYTFADLWSTPEQSGSMVGESTNLLVTTSYGKHCCNLFADRYLMPESPESPAPATSFVKKADGYAQPSYSNNYWPEAGQMAQSYHSGSLNQEFSFGNTVVSEPSTMIPAPSSGKSLFFPKIEFLLINNSSVQLLGGKPGRTIHKHVPNGKRWSSLILV